MNIFSKEPATQNGVKHAVRCHHCPWSMTAAPFVPIVGGSVDTRLLRYVQTLKEHIEKQHPDIGQQIGAYSSFLIAAAFKLEDPFLVNLSAGLRFSLHQQTRAVKITDEMIGERVQKLETIEGLTVQQRDAVLSLMKDMRDVITQSGQYMPRFEVTNPIVTP